MIRSRKLFLFYFLLAAPVFPQVAGRLSGRVVDPSGAIVPVQRCASSCLAAKKSLLTGKTNDAGLFDFIAVQPDRYDVAVEAKVSQRAERVTSRSTRLRRRVLVPSRWTSRPPRAIRGSDHRGAERATC